MSRISCLFHPLLLSSRISGSRIPGSRISGLPHTAGTARASSIPQTSGITQTSGTAPALRPQRTATDPSRLLCAMLAAFMLSSLFWAPHAHAHRVNIFAWVEGAAIHTESSFSNGNKARNSQVTATVKETGDAIAQGMTDADGIWSFTIPPHVLAAGPDILISLNANEGHVNTWTVKGAEYAQDPSITQNTPAPASQQTKKPVTGDDGGMPPFMESHTAPAPAQDAQPGKPQTALPATDELRTIVEEALEKKLAPIRRQLAEESQRGPSMQDIIGGIGYIIGLAGIAAFMAARRKK